MTWFFAHFGLAILIAAIDFGFVFGVEVLSSDKWDWDEVLIVGFVVNALALSIALSMLILGE